MRAKDDISKDILKYFVLDENKNITYKVYSKISVYMEIYSFKSTY